MSAKPNKRVLIKKTKPEPEPDWWRPVEMRYSIAFNSLEWRKVHPPHLNAALAAGGAAIRAHLESVTPHPYDVGQIATSGTYANLMWSTEMDRMDIDADEDDDDE